MARMGDITIELGEDAKQIIGIFIDTRIAFCMATKCRYNRAFIEEEPKEVGCSLKRVDINPEGQCVQYEHI